MASHTPPRLYLSARGGSCALLRVLKGLAPDNGLFIPELAFQVSNLYIPLAEIPPAALKDIIQKSYAAFRVSSVTPTVKLDSDRKIHLLELFYGLAFVFKDVALEFLGNLSEYFIVRRNEGKTRKDREHLTVIEATGGDAGSAAIYGLRGKKDVSVLIMYPTGKASPVREAQMTTVTDKNVIALRIPNLSLVNYTVRSALLSVDGTFDDCQEFAKALFADLLTNKP